MRALKVATDVSSVITCVTGLFQFLTHLSVGDYGSAVNSLTGAFSMMGEALHVAQQQVAGPKALDSAE